MKSTAYRIALFFAPFTGGAIALGALSLLGAECKPVPLPPAPIDGGAAVDAGPGSCAAACAVFAKYPEACPEAAKTDGGLSCVELCTTTPAYAGLPVACVSAATSLEGLRRCNVCALR